MKFKKTQELVLAALLIAIMLIMYRLPFLGYIPLGFMNATLMHIPVIIGSILLGPKKGALLGGVFGLTSFLKATYEPNLTSFVFSPFYSLGDIHGNFYSLVVCFVPRILIGVAAYYVYHFIKKKFAQGKKSDYFALIGAGIAGSMTNTILVMNFIYFFFARSYAEVTGKAFDILYGTILSVIVFSGIPEAIVAAIIVTAVCSILLKLKSS